MHLYKRKNEGGKTWWYKFQYHGVVYQGSTGTKNRRDAEGIASKARLDVIEGKHGIKRQKAAPIFKDAMAKFIDHSRQHNAAGTADRYEAASKPLIKAFGAKALDAITPDDVEDYKTARLSQGGKRGDGRGARGKVKETGRKLKPATVNREVGCLKSMFNHFVNLDTIARSPAHKVKLLPENNEQIRVLSGEEERLYLAACSQPLHDIAVLMIELGMRPEEIYRMRAENVNLEDGYVFNPHGKTKAARRKLPLTRRAADLLKERMAAAEGPYLFPFKTDPNKPMGKVNHAHYAALKRSGIARCRLYDLRHTFATRAAESGVDLVTLAALLGHSKIQMVLRYAHPQEEHKVIAMKKLEEVQIAKRMAEASASDLVQ